MSESAVDIPVERLFSLREFAMEEDGKYRNPAFQPTDRELRELVDLALAQKLKEEQNGVS